MEHALVPRYFGACHYIRDHLTHDQKVAVSYSAERSPQTEKNTEIVKCREEVDQVTKGTT